MTAEQEFVEWLYHESEATLLEVDMDNRLRPEWIDLEDVENTDRETIVRVIREAQKAGYHVGSYDTDRYDGTLSLWR